MCSLPSATLTPSPLSSPPAQRAVQEMEIDHDDNSAYFNSLPPGFRFCPYDDELIDHYLQKKVLNQQLPRNRIPEVELYNYEPEHLSALYPAYGEREWYFFTPRNRKYPKGTRPKRAAGNGYWKATGADKDIYRNDIHVGYRKALVFYDGKPSKGIKSNWIMHEFRVKDESTIRISRGPDDMMLDEWVLCKIYKKLVKPSKEVAYNRESQAEEIDMRMRNVSCSDGHGDSLNNSNLCELAYSYDEMENYMGLINSPVDESNHCLPYNLPMFPSDSCHMSADTFLPDCNINAGHGDLQGSVETIAFKSPMQHTGGNHQPTPLATLPATDDYWGSKQQNYYMSSQLEGFNNNSLSASDFIPVDEIFPKTTGTPALPGDDRDDTTEDPDETTEERPFPKDTSK